MAFRLQIPRPIYEAMLAQARAELPNECCGFLAGQVVEESGRTVGRVVRHYPLPNAADDPTRRYYAEERSLCAAARDIRERGLEELAIYHSHPTSEPVPSRTDLEWRYWHGVVSLIISLAGPETEVCAWWLTETEYREADWELVSDPANRLDSPGSGL